MKKQKYNNLIGCHVSIAGGVFNAPKNAAAVGAECFQMFSRSPRGGNVVPFNDKVVAKFKAAMKKYRMENCYIHSPYFINLASTNNRIYYGSISAIREDLEKGSKLGAKYVMMHIGSAKDLGPKKSIKKAAEGIGKILEDYRGSTKLLIEISAGAGKIIGDSFEEIEAIRQEVAKINEKYFVGVCFDTAHAYESGYDLGDSDAVKETFTKFNDTIGLSNLRLIHVNDSKTKYGSNVDRHAAIGEGEIGKDGIEAVMKYFKRRKIDYILETPGQGKEDIENIKKLKKMRRSL